MKRKHSVCMCSYALFIAYKEALGPYSVRARRGKRIKVVTRRKAEDCLAEAVIVAQRKKGR